MKIVLMLFALSGALFGQGPSRSFMGAATQAFGQDAVWLNKVPMGIEGCLDHRPVGEPVVIQEGHCVSYIKEIIQKADPSMWYMPKCFLVVTRKGLQTRQGLLVRTTLWVGKRFGFHMQSYQTFDLKIIGGEIVF
jgi:hypothetical protein